MEDSEMAASAQQTAVHALDSVQKIEIQLKQINMITCEDFEEQIERLQKHIDQGISSIIEEQDAKLKVLSDDFSSLQAKIDSL